VLILVFGIGMGLAAGLRPGLLDTSTVVLTAISAAIPAFVAAIMLVQSAQSKDLAVVQGISLLLVTAFVVVNLLVDVLYAVLDPRVSLGSRAT